MDDAMNGNSRNGSHNVQGLFPRAVGIWRRGGWRSILASCAERFHRRPIESAYQWWISRFDTISSADRERVRSNISSWERPPMISVVVTDLDPEGAVTHKAIATIHSVREQLYPHWELCISISDSAPAELRQMLAAGSQADPRIRVSKRDWLSRVDRANDALSLATGDYVAFLRCNDRLAADALYCVARTIRSNLELRMINSDEDEFDQHGVRGNVKFKTDWNSSLMLSRDGFGHLGTFYRPLVESLGGFRSELHNGYCYDLVLRCADWTPAAQIRHIPFVLYHSDCEQREFRARRLEERPLNGEGKDTGQRIIEDQLARQRMRAAVRALGDECYQVVHAPVSPSPRVSILIASTGQRRLLEPCLRSLMAISNYANFEVLLLMNERHRKRADASQLIDDFSCDPRLRVFTYSDSPFNYSSVNNWGAELASGDLLCFLNDDTEIITADWMENLVARVCLPEVAAAGPMLYYRNDTIQHAGVILGLGGVAGHACHGMPRGSRGYLDRARLEQDVSCVTAACMMLRKSVFHEIGGFDPAFPIAFNDVDLCLRIRKSGWRIIWTPLVELYHHESASVGQPYSSNRKQELAAAVQLMRIRWGASLDADPYYSPNLSLRLAFNLAFPPRVLKV